MASRETHRKAAEDWLQSAGLIGKSIDAKKLTNTTANEIALATFEAQMAAVHALLASTADE